MTGQRKSDAYEVVMKRVQSLITEALDLLDAHDGSRAAAAHLALALEELRQA